MATPFSYLAQPNIKLQGNEDASIQRLVLQGYKYCQRRTYFIRFQDVKARRIFQDLWQLRRTVEAYTRPFAHKVGKAQSYFVALDVAFTYAGLDKLGVHDEFLQAFRLKNPAFYEGARARAQSLLGDTGWCDPAHWQAHYADLDLLLVVHYAADAQLQEQNATTPSVDTSKGGTVSACIHGLILRVLATHECQILQTEDACPLDFAGTVHFGLKDGITRPIYAAPKPASTSAPQSYSNQHALGEVLLGHPRNDGSNPYAQLEHLLHSYAPSRLGALMDGADSRLGKALRFFRNSSFGVVRKMEQREDVLDAWLQDQAALLVSSDADWPGVSLDASDRYKVTKAWIKAKMLGRKPLDGELLKTTTFVRDVDTPVPTSPAEAGFQDDDANGWGCPFSSHIRRMNPRDDPVVPFISRPLLRRGMAYGLVKDTDKGMAGLFICADIEAQFEHLMGRWANGRVLGLNDPSDCLDPLIGNHQRPDSRLLIHASNGSDAETFVTGLSQPFVVTRGCAYVWFPSVDTLKTLADFIPRA